VKSCPSSHRRCSGTHCSGRPVRAKIELRYVVHIIGAPVFFFVGWRWFESFTATASGQMRFNMESSGQQMHRWPWEKDCIQNVLRTLERELHLRLTWDAFWISRSESERAVPNGFTKQRCLLLHQCSNCHVQDLTLF
jgi:hypothetical protein